MRRRAENRHPAQQIVIPAKAGIHFDFFRSNLDSRFRGNDELSRHPGAGRDPILAKQIGPWPSPG
jgi:hypothetical protein